VPFAQTAAILGAGGLDYAFFDSSLASSLFQDAAGTTPALITNPVGRWNVRQKPPHYASQATSGQRPILQSDGVKFDGISHNLLTDWFAQAGANCIIFLGTPPAGLSSLGLVAGVSGASGAERFFVGFDAGGLLVGGVGGNSVVNIKGAIDRRGQRTFGAIVCNGSTVRLIDGMEQVYSNTQIGAPILTVPFAVGAKRAVQNVSDTFLGVALEKIAFAKVAPTLAEIQSIRAEWLAA